MHIKCKEKAGTSTAYTVPYQSVFKLRGAGTALVYLKLCSEALPNWALTVTQN